MPTKAQIQMEVNDPQSVDMAMASRFSVRAFLPKPVNQTILREILQQASHAPSGNNTQAWKVYVLQGNKRDVVVEQVCAVQDAILANPEIAQKYQEAYDYYPRQWVSPYIDRRRENGWGLYGLLGIGKGDKDKMFAQQKRNFCFFDAPVGLMFTVNKIMGEGSLLDIGMFLQSLALAARARGLHTCAQAAWNPFAKVILPIIGAGDDEMLVCGMSLGYADPDALVNTFKTSRVPVDDFTVWL